MSEAQLPGGIEIRSSTAELRSTGNGRTLAGHAALWNVVTRIGGPQGFREVILPNAFQRSLRSGQDLVALLDHDPARLLGRTRNGTLSLREDDRGLAFELTVPETSYGNDVLALARSQSLGGMSFGFTIDKADKAAERWVGDLRELRAVTLAEISIVAAWPAYPGTTVNARSRLIASPGAVAALRRRRQMEML